MVHLRRMGAKDGPCMTPKMNHGKTALLKMDH